MYTNNEEHATVSFVAMVREKIQAAVVGLINNQPIARNTMLLSRRLSFGVGRDLSPRPIHSTLSNVSVFRASKVKN